MHLVSRDRLAAAYRGADRSAVTDLVAALYEARGHEVDRPAEGQLVLQPGGHTVAVRPADPSELPARADVVDVDTLQEQLHYAVDRERARDLLATHLGIDASGDDAESAGDDPGAFPAGLDGSTLVQPSLVLALVAALALAGALAVGGVATLPGDTAGAEATATPEPATPEPATGPGTETIHTSTPAPWFPSVDEDTPNGSLPPGVDSGGVRDVDELVTAHQTALTNTSFTMTLWYREYADGRLRGTYIERIRVESESRYRVAVSTTGRLQTTPQAVAGVELFVTGDRRHVRQVDERFRFRSRATPARFRHQIGQSLQWSLSADRSALLDRTATADGRTYRLGVEGDPYSVVDDASGTVYVTDVGLITYGRWTYSRPSDGGVRVEFAVQTSDVGTTRVRRPGWVDEG